MKTVTGDIWQFAHLGPLCIPTNGYLARNGNGVMGRGLALQAKERYPDVVYNLGRHLQREGNSVGWILLHPIRLIAVPVKPSNRRITNKDDLSRLVSRVANMYSIGDSVPGYHCKAELSIIRRSLGELVEFANKAKLDSVFIPLLGCGNGELDYETELRPMLDTMSDLSDVFTLVLPPKH